MCEAVILVNLEGFTNFQALVHQYIEFGYDGIV